MRQWILLFIGLGTLMMVMSCRKLEKKVNRNQLIAYIKNPKNNLVKTKTVNGIVVTISYEPSSLLVLREFESSAKKDYRKLAELKEKYNQHLYFLLEFSMNGKEVIRQLDFERYSDMVQTFSFQMSEYISLTIPPADTIHVANYMYEQTFGLTDANKILLCFPKNDMKDSKELLVNIAECGLGVGNMRFSFNRDAIEDIPPMDEIAINR